VGSLLRKFVLLVLAAVAGVVVAAQPPDPTGSRNFTQVGPVWPITEADLLDALLAKARHKQEDGEAAALEKELHQRAEAYAAEPPSLGLPRATHGLARAFDPSVTMPEDIHDAQGRVLIAAGTRVNPLKTLAFDETLLFIDGADPDQLTWLRQRLAREPALLDKVVLTGGSPAILSQQLGRQVFFDQDRQLTGKFGIDAVPATVAADPATPRERLLIREYDPKEKAP
jgi:conjugal transfer pilus assembly protein TraW